MQEQGDPGQTKMIAVPEKFFAGVNEVTEDNRDVFTYIAFQFTMQWIEQCEDDKWALEFPPSLDSNARCALHEVANYFSLSHHSRGKKGKTGNNRQLIMYPRS